ncbi:hypothetical protein GCM10022221_70710 [Actinocorallia aurea]
MTGPGACPGRMTVVLPGDLAHIARARHVLGAWLGRSHPWHDTAVLLLSETLANACAHSDSRLPGGLVEFTAETADRGVRIGVLDAGGGGTPLVARPAASDDEHGRGLWLLNALAKEWSSRSLPDGRREVRFTVDA